jgi:hypothetical protein
MSRVRARPKLSYEAAHPVLLYEVERVALFRQLCDGMQGDLMRLMTGCRRDT